jgi:hypothetical protein
VAKTISGINMIPLNIKRKVDRLVNKYLIKLTISKKDTESNNGSDNQSFPLLLLSGKHCEVRVIDERAIAVKRRILNQFKLFLE